MTPRHARRWAVTGLLLAAGCGRGNNLWLGRVEAVVDGHPVVVTDCYRSSVPEPERLTPGPVGESAYRFAPCRDAVILIRGAHLQVNGREYGTLQAGDEVVVDHGVVSVNRRQAGAASR
jgi:hypothetical protein